MNLAHKNCVTVGNNMARCPPGSKRRKGADERRRKGRQKHLQSRQQNGELNFRSCVRFLLRQRGRSFGALGEYCGVKTQSHDGGAGTLRPKLPVDRLQFQPHFSVSLALTPITLVAGSFTASAGYFGSICCSCCCLHCSCCLCCLHWCCCRVRGRRGRLRGIH